MPIRRITIIGVGLVGGSLGKSWRSSGVEGLEVTGFDRPEVLSRAKDVGAIDLAAASLEEAVTAADLIVLATPLSSIISTLDEMSELAPSGAIVTDVGSVKGPIVGRAAQVLDPGIFFVGGHPMAGSEKGGVDHASQFLFENATWVLCPPADAAEDPRYSELLGLIQTTGARALAMTAEEHDEIAALVSHVPQLLAVVLTNTVGDRNDTNPNVLRLAAGGFRDMTRIAGSESAIWQDILAANHGSILDALALLSAQLQRVRNRLIEEDFGDLESQFRQARKTRESIPKDSKGFIAPLADIYVHADDRPGWIASLATLLADADINIKDMELLKIREGTGGTFRLSFADVATAKRAVNVLKAHNLTAFTLD